MSFVTWHAQQATSIGFCVSAMLLVIWVVGFDRGGMATLGVAPSSGCLGQLGLLAAGPRDLLSAVAALLCGVGMAEALCGRTTSLPLVHGLADRYAREG
ncbi:MAG: hypothetical protein IPH07_39415 [Deltaproteobacteria bacterium]|nr:hypothetical protein [Deltaproteobacteria bacterium]MBP7290570.1 hypothetical protein [Nannocystaceae bacterium]